MFRRGSPPAVLFLLLGVALLALTGTQCKQKAPEKMATPKPAGVARITVEEVKARMDAGEALVFVDSRKGGSWDDATTKLPGAIRVPPGDPENYLTGIPKGKTVITYCT